MTRSIHAATNEVYFDSEVVPAITSRGRGLVATIRDGQIEGRKVAAEVRKYLEDHTNAIGAPRSSAARRNFYDSLYMKSADEIADGLERLVDAFYQMYQRLHATDQSFAAMLKGASA